MSQFSPDDAGAAAPSPLEDAGLAALDRELERSFFAERVALPAGLSQRIRAHLPRPAPLLARRAFRLLGLFMMLAAVVTLLLLYQIYAMRRGGATPEAELSSGVWPGFWVALGMTSCAGAWLSMRIGMWLWLWRRSFAGGRLWNRLPDWTPLQNALGVRVASLAMLLASNLGLWLWRGV